MERITIRIRNRDKAKLLLALLRSLDFVESIETDETGGRTEDISSGVQDHQQQFMALAGMWEDLDITQDALRQKAWPRQTS